MVRNISCAWLGALQKTSMISWEVFTGMHLGQAKQATLTPSRAANLVAFSVLTQAQGAMHSLMTPSKFTRRVPEGINPANDSVECVWDSDVMSALN